MSSPFINAGYTGKTVFKVLKSYECLKEGQLVIIYRDNNTFSPPVQNKGGDYNDMYLPDTNSQELEVVALDGIKEGISDEDGVLLFSTYNEWLESKELNKENKLKTQKKTPFQQNGWTENSVFKVLSDSDFNNHGIGSHVMLQDDDDTDFPLFKSVTGKVISNGYVCFENLHYLGEYDDYMKKKTQSIVDDIYTKGLYKVSAIPL